MSQKASPFTGVNALALISFLSTGHALASPVLPAPIAFENAIASGYEPGFPFNSSSSQFGYGSYSANYTLTGNSVQVGDVAGGVTVNASGVALGGADPSASASISRTGNPGSGGNGLYSAEGNSMYSFEVSGPSGSIIPVVLTGSGAVQLMGGGPNLGASATISVLEADNSGAFHNFYDALACGGNTTYTDGPCYGIASPLTPTFSISTTLNVQSDTLYQVDADASLADTGDNSEFSADASVDPTIQIASNFTGASNYSLVFSPGVNAVTPVPEPASAALLVGAVAGVTFVTRGRRRD